MASTAHFMPCAWTSWRTLPAAKPSRRSPVQTKYATPPHSSAQGICPSGVREEGEEEFGEARRRPKGAPGRPAILVEMAHPHTILAVGEGMLRESCFDESELLGRKLLMLQGPRTDTEALHGLLHRCVLGGWWQPANVIMYNSDGGEMSLHLTSSFAETPSGKPACLLRFASPPGEEADEDSDCGSDEEEEEEETFTDGMTSTA
mmetsp:Transcript_61415/g.147826  ORF Transcript_61415/g.147826 Transcript_61415/m.147826 type:complete len:204 (-) Transcript_61415:164-775(-)